MIVGEKKVTQMYVVQREAGGRCQDENAIDSLSLSSPSK